MKMFRPTHLSFSACLDSLSAYWNTCPLLLFHSHRQHHCFHTRSSPVPRHLSFSLLSWPLSCALVKVQISKKIHLISISMFKVRFTELVWQSQWFVGSRKHQTLSSALTILGLCLECPLNWRIAKWHSAHWEWMAFSGMEKRPSV